MNRREFASLWPALLAAAAVLPEPAPGQQATSTPLPVAPPQDAAKAPLPQLVSGVYPPGPARGTSPRVAHRYLDGMLQAGNIQVEIHETTQEAGTPHEAIGKHLHSEIWLVRDGICELTTNGVTRRMTAGDVGLCVAGDLHYIRNAGDTSCTYFVVTVGPPEP